MRVLLFFVPYVAIGSISPKGERRCSVVDPHHSSIRGKVVAPSADFRRCAQPGGQASSVTAVVLTSRDNHEPYEELQAYAKIARSCTCAMRRGKLR